MSFLDRVPIKWTNDNTITLLNLFVNAYETPTTAETLANTAGIKRGTFPTDYRNMKQLWSRIIEEMSKQGMLRALVKIAVNDPEKTGYHDQFRELLEANVEAECVDTHYIENKKPYLPEKATDPLTSLTGSDVCQKVKTEIEKEGCLTSKTKILIELLFEDIIEDAHTIKRIIKMMKDNQILDFIPYALRLRHSEIDSLLGQLKGLDFRNDYIFYKIIRNLGSISDNIKEIDSLTKNQHNHILIDKRFQTILTITDRQVDQVKEHLGSDHDHSFYLSDREVEQFLDQIGKFSTELHRYFSEIYPVVREA